MTFKALGLSTPLLRAVDKKGYEVPSPIQEEAIPTILNKQDVLASAQTGTGKTAGFTLPMLQLLSDQRPVKGKRAIRALILTPTRELAAQIFENVKEYSEFLDIRSVVIFGGVNANPQISKLRAGVDILIATPGRLLDLQQQGALSLSRVEFLVLDEADRMLDMGFQRDINKIMAMLPKRRQNLLFSATFSKEIKALAGKFLHDPKTIEVTPENSTAEQVEHSVYQVDKPKKTALLIKLIDDNEMYQVLIFTRTKHGANNLTKKLINAGISAAAIHGNKTQNARTKALAGFKDGSFNALVATDIAARGLDIPQLPYVINFELPNIAEDYVHRIGRTGRAGETGEAISLVAGEEMGYLKGIEKLLEEKINRVIVEGYEPTEEEIFVKPKHGSDRKNNSRGRNHNRNRSNVSRKPANNRRR
ncbi:ATP-dependent RNA helicase RhlE [Gangjinia marincola]|uniref:ATP-dependent RNA helicase RhlE n=1 Tax=Gangjinia marincola TaxID=578463 RepID=A0ABN1MDX2_9FLAO